MGSDSLYQLTSLYKSHISQGRQFCLCISRNYPSVITVHTLTVMLCAEGESCSSLQEQGAPTVSVMLGFGYDYSWEKAEENNCSLCVEAGDEPDGWEESCHLHAQGAWTVLIGLISVPALTSA